jgi:hypothetical protein
MNGWICKWPRHISSTILHAFSHVMIVIRGPLRPKYDTQGSDIISNNEAADVTFDFTMSFSDMRRYCKVKNMLHHLSL